MPNTLPADFYQRFDLSAFGVTGAQRLALETTLSRIYEYSARGKQLFDQLNTTDKLLTISKSPVGVGTGAIYCGNAVQLDFNPTAGPNGGYIDQYGTFRQLELIRVLAHEALHAIEGTVDFSDGYSAVDPDYKGETVEQTNLILAQIEDELPGFIAYERLSYNGSRQIDATLPVGTSFTGGIGSSPLDGALFAKPVEDVFTLTGACSLDSQPISLVNLDTRQNTSKINDLLIGDLNDNILQSGDGRDGLHGGRGNDLLEGGLGNDYIDGGDGNDTIYGEELGYNVGGTIYVNELYGGDGEDFIHTQSNFDSVFGGNGNDTIVASGTWANGIDGGPGYDILDLRDMEDPSNAPATAIQNIEEIWVDDLSILKNPYVMEFVNPDTVFVIKGDITLDADVLDFITPWDRSKELTYVPSYYSNDHYSYTLEQGALRQLINGQLPVGNGDDFHWVDPTGPVYQDTYYSNTWTLFGNVPFRIAPGHSVTINLTSTSPASGHVIEFGVIQDDYWNSQPGQQTINASGFSVERDRNEVYLSFTSGNERHFKSLADPALQEFSYSWSQSDFGTLTDHSWLSTLFTEGVYTSVQGNSHSKTVTTADMDGAGGKQIAISESIRSNTFIKLLESASLVGSLPITAAQQAEDFFGYREDLFINLNTIDTVQVQMLTPTTTQITILPSGVQPPSGTNSDDNFAGTAGADVVSLLDGNDYYAAGGGSDRITGDLGADTILGEAGDDDLYGGGNNDSLSGGGGEDTLWGGSGNDVLQGGNNNDELYGEAGDDRLFGDIGSDTLNGGSGNDVLAGGNANDDLFGGAGDDTLRGQGSLDNMSGGDGNDLLDGGAGPDYIDGDAGNDTLLGGAFNDQLRGGTGDDLLDGGTGKDTLNGGSGSDTLTGGSRNDFLAGDSGNNRLDGGIGSDNLSGGSGIDTLIGGAANDTLSGGPGKDLVDGGTGSDLLRVLTNQGGDTLTGGAGADTFKFHQGFNTATIADFTRGQDKIDLTSVSVVSQFGDLNIGYGSDTVIDLGGGDSITINGPSNGLAADDFLF